MESTGAEESARGAARGWGGGRDGDSADHERPGVLWLQLQLGVRNSRRQCVHTSLCPASRALGPLSSRKEDGCLASWSLE